MPAREVSRGGWLGAWLCAVLAALFLFAPLREGIPKAYDTPDHLGTLQQFLDQLERGDPYPRWMSEFNGGWGEPTMIFYPPALYFASAGIAKVFGGDLLVGLFGVLFLSAVAGGLGMWIFLREEFGRGAAILAPLTFALIPYRFFEIYCAGLYSAFAAGCLLPGILWTLRKIGAAETSFERQWALLSWALCVALLFLFNLPAAILFAYLIACWLSVELLVTRRWRLAGDLALGAVWGGLLAAVYLLPAARELSAVQVPHSATPLFRSNFLFQASGSWMSPGLKSLFDRMALLPSLGFLLALLLLWSFRAREGAAAGAARAIWLRLVTAVGLAALVLATPLSEPLWRSAPLLQSVNLPWRLLAPFGVATAAASSAAASAASATVQLVRTARRSRLVAGLVLAFFAALALLLAVFDQSISSVNGKISAAQVRAAIPAWTRKPGYFLPRGARPPAELPAIPRADCGSPCHVDVLEWGPSLRRLKVRAPAAARVTLRTYDFPGWSARREGTRREPLFVSQDPATGGLVVAVPAGETLLRVSFESTPDRRAGSLISAAALIAWLAAAASLRRFRRAPEKAE